MAGVSWWQQWRTLCVGLVVIALARTLVAEEDPIASLASKQDPTALQFASMESRCHYHCSASHFRPDLADCNAAHCAQRRLQVAKNQPIQSVNLVTCRLQEQRSVPVVSFLVPNAHLSASETTSSKLFANITQQLLQAYDAVITDINARLDACELHFVQQHPIDQIVPSLTTDNAQQARPMLFKLHSSANHDQRDCMQQLRTISNQTFTPLISRSDSSFASSTIVLVHATKAIANQINDLDCIESVTQLPAILKLMPFARSASRLADQETQETPRMEIALVKSSNRSQVFESLSQQFESLTGIVNAFELPSSEQDRRENVVFLRSLHDMETWVKAVSLAITNDQVEWVDRRMQLSRNVMRGSSIIALNHGTRRLDQHVGDLIGIKEAQKHGVKGNGVVVGITDSGLYVRHDQFDQISGVVYGPSSVKPDARKVTLYYDWGDRYDESESGECGHGTHVSGILAGSSNTGRADLGIAPKAKIAFMDIGAQDRNCLGESGCPVFLSITPEASSLLSTQMKAGARIFSFSWGANENDYTGLARDLDQFLYENPEVLVVVAAGNTPKTSEVAPGTIMSPGGAKNVLSVGASLNTAASFGDNSIGHNCPEVFNELSVADFSSAGPTSDGRLKPDIVAPGMPLVSAKSLKPGSTATTTDTCSLQGTSQATPIVAGMAVLLYEWLRDGWWKDGVPDERYSMQFIPSSLLKALVIHSSQGLRRRLPLLPKNGAISCASVAGRTLPLQYPDMYQGYGRPNMSNIAEFVASVSGGASGTSLFFLPNNSNGSQPVVKDGKAFVIRFTVPRDLNLRATLVWTDPAGASRSATTLQNDLDLVIRLANGKKEFGPLTADTITGRDTLNNVEMVQVTYADLAAAAKEEDPSLVGPAGDIVVEASVVGRCVLQSDNQSFAFVASSNPVSDSFATREMSSGDSIWSTGRLIGVIAGVLVLLLLVACGCKFCRQGSKLGVR